MMASLPALLPSCLPDTGKRREPVFSTGQGATVNQSWYSYVNTIWGPYVETRHPCSASCSPVTRDTPLYLSEPPFSHQLKGV